MFVLKRTGYFFGCSIFHHIQHLHVSCTHATILLGFKSFLFGCFIVLLVQELIIKNKETHKHWKNNSFLVCA